MQVETDGHTVPHFKAPVYAKMELWGPECGGTFNIQTSLVNISHRGIHFYEKVKLFRNKLKKPKTFPMTILIFLSILCIPKILAYFQGWYPHYTVTYVSSSDQLFREVKKCEYLDQAISLLQKSRLVETYRFLSIYE